MHGRLSILFLFAACSARPTPSAPLGGINGDQTNLDAGSGNVSDTLGNPAAPKATDADTQAPQLAVTSAAVTDSATFTLSGTASDNVAVSRITVDDAVASGAATWSMTVHLPTLGLHSFVVSAFDAAGNRTDVQTSVTRYDDTSAPVIADVFPFADMFTESAFAKVRINVTDDSGVEAVSVGDVPATFSGIDNYWTAEVPLTVGTHALTVSATDLLGKVATAPLSLRRSKPMLGTLKALSRGQSETEAYAWDSLRAKFVRFDPTSSDGNVEVLGIDATGYLPFAMSAHPDALYFVDLGKRLVRASLSDNTIALLATAPSGVYSDLRVTTSGVFAIEPHGDVTDVWRFDLDGGHATKITTLQIAPGKPLTGISIGVNSAANPTQLFVFTRSGLTRRVDASTGAVLDAGVIGTGSLGSGDDDGAGNMYYVSQPGQAYGKIGVVNMTTGAETMSAWPDAGSLSMAWLGASNVLLAADERAAAVVVSVGAAPSVVLEIDGPLAGSGSAFAPRVVVEGEGNNAFYAVSNEKRVVRVAATGRRLGSIVSGAPSGSIDNIVKGPSGSFMIGDQELYTADPISLGYSFAPMPASNCPLMGFGLAVLPTSFVFVVDGNKLYSRKGNTCSLRYQAQYSYVGEVIPAFDPREVFFTYDDEIYSMPLTVSPSPVLLSGPTRGNGPITTRRFSRMRTWRDRILVSDSHTVFEVTPSTGDRRIIVDNTTAGFPQAHTSMIVVDDLVYTASKELGALLALDPISGGAYVFSR